FGRVTSVSLHQNGRVLTTGTDRSVRLWEIASGKELWNDAFPGEVHQAAVHPSGNWVATVSAGAVYLCEIATKQREKLPAPVASVPTVASVPARPEGWKERLRADEPVEATGAVFRPDNSRLLILSKDGLVREWDSVQRRYQPVLEFAG